MSECKCNNNQSKSRMLFLAKKLCMMACTSSKTSTGALYTKSSKYRNYPCDNNYKRVPLAIFFSKQFYCHKPKTIDVHCTTPIKKGGQIAYKLKTMVQRKPSISESVPERLNPAQKKQNSNTSQPTENMTNEGTDCT